MAVGIEMRRAVRIWEGGRVEGVRHEPVDAAHQHVIGQPLTQAVAFAPAIGTKQLAHGAAFLRRV